MENEIEVDDRRKGKQPCEKGCGKEFSPAGKVYHEKFCKGPGYKPGYVRKNEPVDDSVEDQRKVKRPCGKGCGKSFKPGSKEVHERYCKGPGYKTKRSRRLDRIQEANEGFQNLYLCRKGCGRKIASTGVGPHEKACTGPGYISQRSKAVDKIVQRLVPKTNVKMKKQIARSPLIIDQVVAPVNAVKKAYEMFRDDAALCLAVCNIIACASVENTGAQIAYLTQARDALTLKIEDLMENG